MNTLEILFFVLLFIVFYTYVGYLSKPQHYPKNIVFYSVNHSVIG